MLLQGTLGCDFDIFAAMKEDSGRQLRLVTPENGGGIETSCPSPPRFTFFDDHDSASSS